jgi:hypothetical protein
MAMAVLLLLFSAAAATRTTVSLDFGWRAAPAAPQPCSASAFSRVFHNMTLGSGWAPLDAGAAGSAEACARAACAANVLAYSYCAAGAPCAPLGGGALCVIGSSGLVLQAPFWARTPTNPTSTYGWVMALREVAVPPADAPHAAHGRQPANRRAHRAVGRSGHLRDRPGARCGDQRRDGRQPPAVSVCGGSDR